MTRNQIHKKPSEKWPVQVDFENKLPPGLTILSGALAAFLISDGTTDNSVFVSPVASIDGNKLGFTIKDGLDKTKYKLVLTATLSDGTSKLVEDIFLDVDA